MINQILFKQTFCLKYDNLKTIRQWLKTQSNKLNLSHELSQHLILVCNEYCVNLLSHQELTASHVELKYGLRNNQARFEIIDNGSHWQAMKERISAATLPKEPTCNKLGLALINTYFPDFKYYLTNSQNIIEFKLPQKKPKPQLLIVDDSPSQLALFSSFLYQSYQLILFSKPCEALEWLSHNRCDMVITDLHMPDIDGFNFRDKVTKLNHCQSLPFIFISADNKDTTLLEAARAGIDDYLTKPLNKEKLLTILKRVLKRHSTLASVFEKQLLAQMTPYQSEFPSQITLRDITIDIDQYPINQGDFLLYRKPENNKPAMLILGDNMGHGPLAKANGIGWFGYIAGLLDAGIESPKEICEILNQQLIAAPNNRHLICLMIMIIDNNNTVHIYNAGMPAALQLSHDKSIHLEENMGLLGINTQLTIEPQLITLTKDVSLHCYSDGITNQPITIKQINQLTHYKAKERHKKIWQKPQRSTIDDKTLISIYR
ncbi:response regulator [Photobacterium angustum]|uniref:Two-component system response regulator n=1 Tax=Photobacterium angustum TaxID=661 RepID=A0A855S9W3_PHOAN|nr:response regulator [Photobacterium angustum]KJF79734.1 chemotaxis protein CheY [Photobacterium damselae subsp. damselae]KJG35705.1 chemotaxis protein CheY [Photobacterium angustum]KJG43231.1 chemotaxis protein CheY [Photobacterium angustum]KJG44775.1 chemotaxis protein CheY [Photobacterium angustum]KJG51135.1 chemotaxis protein CheY [Photobacterium angustum]